MMKLKRGVYGPYDYLQVRVLEEIARIAKDIPSVDNVNAASRFGNPDFKPFYDKVFEVRRTILYLAFKSICLFDNPWISPSCTGMCY